MENHKPERLILPIPEWLWPFNSGTIAFCLTRNRAISAVSVCVGLGIPGAVYLYFNIPYPLTAVVFVGLALLFLMVILLALPSIFIRKDCFECRLGFYVMEHERNHLRLRKSEVEVAQETLRQTGDRLISLLLSNPDMCKDCPLKADSAKLLSSSF